MILSKFNTHRVLPSLLSVMWWISYISVFGRVWILTMEGSSRLYSVGQVADEGTMNPLILVCVAVFMVQLDTTILYVAFPSIQTTFSQVSQKDLAWIINVYTILYGSFLIPAGAYADQWGRRRFFVVGVSIFTLASLACGLSSNVSSLIFFRGLQAFGAAMLMPSSLALVLALVPQAKRAVAVSLWGASGAIATALGPSLGALIIEHFSWRMAFYINLPFGIYAAYAALRYISESRQARERIPSLLASTFLAMTLILLSLAAMDRGIGFYQTGMYYLCGALGALGAFYFTNRMAPSPAIDFALFKDRTTSLAYAGVLLFSAAFSCMFLGLIFFATRVWNFSIFKAGLLMTPGPITTFLATLLAGRFAQQHGHRWPILTGGILFSIGIAVRLLWPSHEVNIALGWVPCVLLIGVGVGFVSPSLNTAATFNTPKDRYAMGSGISTTFRQIGSAIGVIITVLTVDGVEGFPLLFSVTLLLALGSAICGFGVDTAPKVNVTSPQQNLKKVSGY